MKEVKTITLENGIEYFLVDEILLNDITYFVLASTNDNSDLCIRKREIINGTSYVVTLGTNEELFQVLEALKNKKA